MLIVFDSSHICPLHCHYPILELVPQHITAPSEELVGVLRIADLELDRAQIKERAIQLFLDLPFIFCNSHFSLIST